MFEITYLLLNYLLNNNVNYIDFRHFVRQHLFMKYCTHLKKGFYIIFLFNIFDLRQQRLRVIVFIKHNVLCLYLSARKCF